LLLFLAAVCVFVILRRSEAPSFVPPATPAGRLAPASAYPDPDRTPGLANPEITQENIAETICNPDWSTRTIRPASSYTRRLKRRQMEALGLSGAPGDYEEDHFISLELGGHPSDPRNLWPEAYAGNPGARQKDVVENYLHKEVCGGSMTLAEAQAAIVKDWYAVYVRIAH
jgi:hypothetical protein